MFEKTDRRGQFGSLVALLVCLFAVTGEERLFASSLTLELDNAARVTFVGAFCRWDADGNARRPVNPKAKIDAPEVDAVARRVASNRWVFENLAPGRYDLVILARDRVRIEGFGYPPVLEFDPFVDHRQRPPDQACEWIRNDIAKSRYYENKVTPLSFAGDADQVRVLVQLLRDKPTSYDGQYGQQVATLRHEIWQYLNRYGAWSKEKRTRVLDRILTGKSELRRWTWIWEPALGQISITEGKAVVEYALPHRFDHQHSGLLPY